MRYIAKLSLILFLAIFLSACFDTEEFPDSPSIEFESLDYVDTDGVDSLILSFRFEDGDGNIGLNSQESDLREPYQIYNVVVDVLDSIVTIDPNQTIDYPLYEAPVEVMGNIYTYIPQNGEGTPLATEDIRSLYNCEDYEIFGEDTLFVTRNEFHYNFHADFLSKRGSEQYEVMDFREIFNSDDCTLGNFDGRIPWFDPNGNEGVITYAMLSQAFDLAFLEDSIKIRFYIYDRALNKSNTVESPAFVLSGL